MLLLLERIIAQGCILMRVENLQNKQGQIEEVNDIKILEYWQLVKLLNVNIIAPKKDPLINNELANVLISNELSYQNKAELILNFNEKTWRNVYLLMNNKENHIGFRVRKNECAF